MVLIAGGNDGTDVRSPSAELYDPTSGTWTPTGSLNTPHVFFTATLLQNGMALVAGGNTGRDSPTTELYDPASGTWTATGTLHTARYFHTATLLQNGRLLVAGGADRHGHVTATAEIGGMLASQ